MKPLYLRIVGMRDETADIRRYTLASLDGAHLPMAEAGAHIRIFLPPNMVRAYSLCAPSRDGRIYEIAVKREDGGRGGSRRLHGLARPGGIVKAMAPRNDFPLRPARRYRFLASGIGITPIRAMMEAAGATPCRLDYCVRAEPDMPFAEDIRRWVREGRCSVHVSAAGGRLDLAAELAEPEAGEQLYCCGSAGFMAAAAHAARRWPREALHFEAFGTRQASADNEPCIVHVLGDPDPFAVASDETVLEALRARGHDVDSVCENGACGACAVEWIGGSPLHRDVALTEGERRGRLCTCVSRSADSQLPLLLRLPRR